MSRLGYNITVILLFCLPAQLMHRFLADGIRLVEY